MVRCIKGFFSFIVATVLSFLMTLASSPGIFRRAAKYTSDAMAQAFGWTVFAGGMDPMIGPVPKEFGDYVSSLGGALEVIPDVLYSVKDYTSGATRVQTFFDTSTQNGRIDLTNMQAANSLPAPQSFMIQNIRLFFWTVVQTDDSGDADAAVIPCAFNDVVALTTKGVFQMTINQKQYGPWPLWMLPANSFVKGAFSTGSDLLANYGQLDGNLYPLLPPLVLLPLQPFTVTLSWPSGPVTLSTGAESTVGIQVLFDGKRARSIT